MSYKSELMEDATKLALKFEGRHDAPLVCISGSVGDPYGHPHSLSDIEMNAWVINDSYMDVDKYPTLDWTPYIFTGKKEDPKKSGGVIDELEQIGGPHISVLFRIFDIDKFRGEIEAIRKNPSKEQIDRCISKYLEKTLFKDETGIYAIGAEKSRDSFSVHRRDLAKEALNEIQDPSGKLIKYYKISCRDEPIDISAYNSRVRDIINLLTYVQCCAKDLPRSYRNIRHRQKNVLWEALGMDREMIDRAFTSSEKVEPAYEALRELVSGTYDMARKELPEIEGSLPMLLKKRG